MNWTFQSLIDEEQAVHVTCNACNHHSVLDLPALREKFGGDAPAMNWDLVPRLRCTRCGRKDAHLAYLSATNKDGWPGSYLKAKGS